jgi:hypothetical protein
VEWLYAFLDQEIICKTMGEKAFFGAASFFVSCGLKLNNRTKFEQIASK